MSATITPERNEQRPGRRRRRLVVVAIVAVIVVAAIAVAGILYFFRGDEPPAVDLQDAAASITSPGETGEEAVTTVTVASSVASSVADASPTTAATATPVTPSIEGTWTVDTSVGTFSYEESTGTFVGVRINEELASIGSTTAVARTPDVAGSITVEGTTLTAATIEADMTTMTTNDSRRDDAVLEALETTTFPTATFVLTEPVELGADAVGGAAIDVAATGDLTIHGVTASVTIPLQAQLVAGVVVVVGSIDITFADYGVSVPESRIVVSAEDHGILELQLFLQPT